jgi:hypothetical protein
MSNIEPYIIHPTGLKGLAFKMAFRTISSKPLLVIDADGIHWPDPKGKRDFTIGWDEISEIVRQRSWGMQALFVVVKDKPAVLARHPMKHLPIVGPSPFSIPRNYAPLDEVIVNVRRFSDVPIREK